MDKFYLTIMLCTLSIVQAQRTPTISHITQEQIRDIGDQVDLACSVHYAQDYPVIWVKYDQAKSVESIPLSNNAGLIIKDSRFSLRYDDSTATFTLSIKDIQENDAGFYQCQVLITVTNKIAAEVELQVRRPPIISDNSTRSLVASEGESVQMECYAGGFPSPKISWRRENNAILPTGGSIYRGNILKIASVHKEDRGTYYCVAENGVGKGARRNINLEVEFAPVVTVPKPRLAQIFDQLKEQMPKFRHKVVVVPGDCEAAGLGLTITDRQMLIDKVNIIFHSAATVKFDEHLRSALGTNVQAPLYLLELAKLMQDLDVFMHISTAYSNSHLDTVEEKFYEFPTSVDKIQRVVDKMTDRDIEDATPKLLGPWPNTYTFTKALAEKEIREKCGKIPVGIFRPAIVTSTAKEPLRCWLDNMYGPTGVAVGTATGVLRALHCNGSLTADIVPVDLVVNCLVAAAVSVSERYRKSPLPEEPPIFNYVSSPDNSITWNDFRAKNLESIDNNPFSNAVWYISITMNKSAWLHKICMIFLHLLPAALVDGLAMCIGKEPKMLKVYRKIHKFSSVLSYFTTKEIKFYNTRVQELWENTSEVDKKLFPFNMRELDWNEYFDHYLIGIRRYLFKENDSTIPRAKIKWKRLYYLHQIVRIIFRCLLVYIIWSVIKLLFL